MRKTRIDLRGNDATARCPCGWWQTYCGDPKAKAARAGLIGHRRMKHGLRSHSKIQVFVVLNTLLLLLAAAAAQAQVAMPAFLTAQAPDVHDLRSGPAMPDPTLTPGAFRPLSAAKVCTIKWGRDERHVTPKMKREICAAYGAPLSGPNRCPGPMWELDHLGSRELAGADVKENVWAQPIAEARMKDRLENLLHRMVCAAPPSRRDAMLKEAQHEIVTDWWHAYLHFFPAAPPKKKQPAQSPLADYRFEEARQWPPTDCEFSDVGVMAGTDRKTCHWPDWGKARR